jgi:hypothetical protein
LSTGFKTEKLAREQMNILTSTDEPILKRKKQNYKPMDFNECFPKVPKKCPANSSSTDDPNPENTGLHNTSPSLSSCVKSDSNPTPSHLLSPSSLLPIIVTSPLLSSDVKLFQ